jgi:uncharacterized protein
MELSKHNILTKIHGDARWLLVNLLSGQADLLPSEDGERLARGEITDADALAGKGYLVDPAEEQRRYRAAYLEFLKERDTDEIQIFYVPSYVCNFGCSYCFQDEYAPPPGKDGATVLEAFFEYVDETFADRRKYVTLFGGEPLLPSPSARRVVEQMVEGTAARGLDLAVITNGYSLTSYVDTLKRTRIREVQITLDGPQKIHDARRYLKGGGETFMRVVEGVDAALAAGLPVNLRSVLDRENVESFAELAHFAIDRGWTDNPLFKTQIGRNYELHHCQSDRARLYSRLELFQDLHRLVEKDPEILRFHQPAFSISRFLFERGELPAPLFDACPATKTEWAFDYTGRIYSCTATVGKQGEVLGTFWPERKLDRETIEQWKERDVVTMDKCSTCPSQLACGGGCGAVAKNWSGRIDASDCRPVKELLSLGASIYGREALDAAE